MLGRGRGKPQDASKSSSKSSSEKSKLNPFAPSYLASRRDLRFNGLPTKSRADAAEFGKRAFGTMRQSASTNDNDRSRSESSTIVNNSNPKGNQEEVIHRIYKHKVNSDGWTDQLYISVNRPGILIADKIHSFLKENRESLGPPGTACAGTPDHERLFVSGEIIILSGSPNSQLLPTAYTLICNKLVPKLLEEQGEVTGLPEERGEVTGLPEERGEGHVIQAASLNDTKTDQPILGEGDGSPEKPTDRVVAEPRTEKNNKLLYFLSSGEVEMYRSNKPSQLVHIGETDQRECRKYFGRAASDGTCSIEMGYQKSTSYVFEPPQNGSLRNPQQNEPVSEDWGAELARDECGERPPFVFGWEAMKYTSTGINQPTRNWEQMAVGKSKKHLEKEQKELFFNKTPCTQRITQRTSSMDPYCHTDIRKLDNPQLQSNTYLESNSNSRVLVKPETIEVSAEEYPDCILEPDTGDSIKEGSVRTSSISSTGSSSEFVGSTPSIEIRFSDLKPATVTTKQLSSSPVTVYGSQLPVAITVYGSQLPVAIAPVKSEPLRSEGASSVSNKPLLSGVMPLVPAQTPLKAEPINTEPCHDVNPAKPIPAMKGFNIDSVKQMADHMRTALTKGGLYTRTELLEISKLSASRLDPELSKLDIYQAVWRDTKADRKHFDLENYPFREEFNATYVIRDWPPLRRLSSAPIGHPTTTSPPIDFRPMPLSADTIIIPDPFFTPPPAINLLDTLNTAILKQPMLKPIVLSDLLMDVSKPDCSLLDTSPVSERTPTPLTNDDPDQSEQSDLNHVEGATSPLVLVDSVFESPKIANRQGFESLSITEDQPGADLLLQFVPPSNTRLKSDLLAQTSLSKVKDTGNRTVSAPCSTLDVNEALTEDIKLCMESRRPTTRDSSAADIAAPDDENLLLDLENACLPILKTEQQPELAISTSQAWARGQQVSDDQLSNEKISEADLVEVWIRGQVVITPKGTPDRPQLAQVPVDSPKRMSPATLQALLSIYKQSPSDAVNEGKNSLGDTRDANLNSANPCATTSNNGY